MIGSCSQPLRPPPCELKNAYERLRASMLQSPHETERGAGYGLIVQRGLLVWMCTWAAYAPFVSVAPRPSAPMTSLPPIAERDLVHALVSLVVGARRNNASIRPTAL